MLLYSIRWTVWTRTRWCWTWKSKRRCSCCRKPSTCRWKWRNCTSFRACSTPDAAAIPWPPSSRPAGSPSKPKCRTTITSLSWTSASATSRSACRPAPSRCWSTSGAVCPSATMPTMSLNSSSPSLIGPTFGRWKFKKKRKEKNIFLYFFVVFFGKGNFC